MNIGKHASKISFAIFGSRILGLIRDQIFAALIGAGFLADAYVIAFRIPNLLRDLFAEGSLTNAFVPTLTQVKENQSDQAAWELVRITLAWVLLLVGTLTLLGIFFAPQIVQWIAPGFVDVAGKLALTAKLARIMFPFLVIVSIASVLMGIHNVEGRFALPALAPMAFNLVSIAFGLLIWLLGSDGQSSVILWSVGTLCGGLGQCLIQLPPLLRKGDLFWPKFRGMFSHPQIRGMGMLMLPSVIAVSGTQVNVLVNSILASLLQQGAPSWLNYAFRLMQLPLGVFGVAISMVTLASVSKDVAQKNPEKVVETLSSSIILTLLLTLPCSFGLWVLGKPILALIYQRGAFSSSDTLATSLALHMYALGLPMYALVKVVAPVFFSLGQAKKPMAASLTGIALNIGFNLWAYQKLGHSGLALGTSLGMSLNFLMLMSFLPKQNIKLPYKKIFRALLTITVSSVIMAGLCLYLYKTLEQSMGRSLGHRLIYTLLPVSMGAAIYFALLWILALPEARLLIQKIKEKIG
ncbi:MAG: murein biosynthesis integral membrane protein MurJ [Bdellovibrionales bacterium]|nr:murein biosynthesis integral membrane protein MurJ [Bdellovibrionales bacterium]